MSIVPLHRATFVGLAQDKEPLLDSLHDFGNLEIIPLTRERDLDAAIKKRAAPTQCSRDALKFLLASPQRRRQSHDRTMFDAAQVERQARELQSRIHDLESERDDLLERIEGIKPFGDFSFASLQQMGDFRLWFYVVPHSELPKVASALDEQTSTGSAAWEAVTEDSRHSYVVVVSPEEPTDMPVPRQRIGARSLKQLSQRLEEVELAIEDAQAERAYLTRWCLLFARSLTQLDDAAARSGAAELTCDIDSLFALKAWVPREHIDELAELAEARGIMFEHRPPTPNEDPPTLMRNEPRVEAGEDLVNFYMTPGYWTWDPSRTVTISFAIFFAMILADAGYAFLLGLGLASIWRKLGQPTTAEARLTHAADIEQGEPLPQRTTGQRFRPLLLLIVVFSFVYGVLVGSYFGITPSSGSLLSKLNLLDMSNTRLMMGISVLVGGVHVILANIMNALRYDDWRDGLASFGWAIAVAGGLVAGAGATSDSLSALKLVGAFAAVIGLVLVVGYTARQEKPLRRLLAGMLGLTKVSAAFGDILSYLRLFALGLASASLASAFNDMAAGIHGALPRLGLLFALLVLLFGHALNMLLGVSSGVIHGLRLNVIEFFNWGLKDEGRRFTPFRRKEGSLWN
ncbi:V-type ATP synthase subunit I [Rhodopirellula sallentina]|uniref:V-type ATPase n=1 Tax=Rhodopirellula sallentina SM41 TaxID=1263870 RepID=M5U9C9_9BACT|nr:V-type ATPase [Rhodopirellula sallentina]EMI52588.1 V-type ATPase [Rhodopirellula sallentina SM41]